MDPKSLFHVAIKAADLTASEAFYRRHFAGEVVDRGTATDGEGATAVNHVALDVGDKLVYLFDEAPYEAADIVDGVPRPGFSTTASSSGTSTPLTVSWWTRTSRS